MVPLLHHLRRQPPIPHSGITDAYLASAVYALVFTLFLGCIGYPLYLKKIYIKL